MLLGQISDIHGRRALPGSSQYVERRCREAFSLLEEALVQLRKLGADFVAVTGDLLDVPDYIVGCNEYYDYDRAQFDRDIEADYRTVRKILDGSGLAYTVLPGNHDVPRVMWRVFDEGANLVDVAGYRIARFCDLEWEKHVPRRLDRERKLWESLLADADLGPQIHLQHYVVTPAINDWYPHTYLEGEEIKNRNAASGKVALSLSGHYHGGTELLKHGTTFFSTAKPVCEFPYTFRVFDVKEGAVVQREIAMREKPLTAGRRVVFLDRDGVINEQGAYNSGPSEMRLIPGAAQAVADLRNAGYAIVILTNQSAVGSGYVTEGTIHAVHDRMCRLMLAEAGEASQADAIFFSIGAGDRAIVSRYADQSDAKPNTVMVERAVEALKLELGEGYFVGDRATDIQTAINAKITPILVRTGFGRRDENQIPPSVRVFDDLRGAAVFILG